VTNTKLNIAMFIDADNAPAKHIDKVLTDLAIYGAVSIRKAYGNWKNPVIKSWEDRGYVDGKVHFVFVWHTDF